MYRNGLRVLTLNCWNLSEPYAARMELIRDGLAALRPDLVGLQEIVVRSDGFDQAADILEGLGYEYVFGAAFRWDAQGAIGPFDSAGDAFGNVVASRWPIEGHAVYPLPGDDDGERRSALATLVGTPFGHVPFVTTHLNWKFHHGAVRERQVVALADLARQWQAGADSPPIIVGDLNAEPDSNEIRYLCGLASLEGRSTFFQDAWRVAGNGPGYTWDNRNRFAAYMFEPDRRIDYVLVGLADINGRGWIDNVQVTLNQPRGDVFPSDHFAVLADIRM